MPNQHTKVQTGANLQPGFFTLCKSKKAKANVLNFLGSIKATPDVDNQAAKTQRANVVNHFKAQISDAIARSVPGIKSESVDLVWKDGDSFSNDNEKLFLAIQHVLQNDPKNKSQAYVLNYREEESGRVSVYFEIEGGNPSCKIVGEDDKTFKIKMNISGQDFWLELKLVQSKKDKKKDKKVTSSLDDRIQLREEQGRNKSANVLTQNLTHAKKKVGSKLPTEPRKIKKYWDSSWENFKTKKEEIKNFFEELEKNKSNTIDLSPIELEIKEWAEAEIDHNSSNPQTPDNLQKILTQMIATSQDKSQKNNSSIGGEELLYSQIKESNNIEDIWNECKELNKNLSEINANVSSALENKPFGNEQSCLCHVYLKGLDRCVEMVGQIHTLLVTKHSTAKSSD